MLHFLSVLSDTPTNGHAFIVSGITSANAEKFNVALTCGKTPNADIAMMLTVDFVYNKIFRRACVNECMTEMESTQNFTGTVANPISRYQHFKIYIMVSDDRFHVSINDEPFCSFIFKLPVKNVKAILVTGDLDSVTQADHRKVFPVVYPLVNHDYDDIVFRGYIPKNYSPGHVVIIAGIATESPEGEFVIMFNENDCRRQMLHFNPRFEGQTVVMNSMNEDDDDSWSETQTCTDHMPFVLNQPFKLAFAFTETELKVALNGQYLIHYKFEDVEVHGYQTIWEMLTGFQVKVRDGLEVQIKHVEHVMLTANCDGFESYSN